MVKKIKIELPKRYGKRKNVPKPPETRQQYAARKMDILFKKYNKADPAQRKLEESLKNKDFTLYNQLRTKGVANAEEGTIRNSIQAMQLIKSKLQTIIDEVYSYNPNIKEVDEIEKGAEALIETLEKQTKYLLLLLPKVGKLSKEDQNKLDVITRDVERYSVDLNKIDGLLKVLQTREEKLDPKLVEQLKARKKIKQEEEDLKKDVSEVFRFGLDTTKIEQDKLRKALDDPLKRDIISEDVKNRADLYKDKLIKLKIQYTTLNEIFNNINDERAKVVKGNGSGPVNTFNTQYKDITNALSMLEDFILKPSIASIGDIERYMSLDTKEISKLSTAVEQVIKDGNKLLKNTKDVDKVPKVKDINNIWKNIDDNVNTMQNLIKSVTDAYVLIADVFVELKNYNGIKGQGGEISNDLIDKFINNGISIDTKEGKKIYTGDKYSHLLNGYNEYSRQLLLFLKKALNGMLQFRSSIKSYVDKGLLENAKSDMVDYYEKFKNYDFINMTEDLVKSLELIVKDPKIIRGLKIARGEIDLKAEKKELKKQIEKFEGLDKKKTRVGDIIDQVPKDISPLKPLNFKIPKAKAKKVAPLTPLNVPPVPLSPQEKKDVQEAKKIIADLNNKRLILEDEHTEMLKILSPSKKQQRQINQKQKEINKIEEQMANQNAIIDKIQNTPKPIPFKEPKKKPITKQRVADLIVEVKTKYTNNKDYRKDLMDLELAKEELVEMLKSIREDYENKNLTKEEAENQTELITDDLAEIMDVEKMVENNNVFATPPLQKIPNRQSISRKYLNKPKQQSSGKKKSAKKGNKKGKK